MLFIMRMKQLYVHGSSITHYNKVGQVRWLAQIQARDCLILNLVVLREATRDFQVQESLQETTFSAVQKPQRVL